MLRRVFVGAAAPAGGAIDREIALLGELYRADVLVWDSTGSIHQALLHRALHEKPDLDSTAKKLRWIGEVTASGKGDLAWMIVGSTRVALLMEVLAGDAEFLALDPAGRKARIEAHEKEGAISSSDRTAFTAAYAATK